MAGGGEVKIVNQAIGITLSRLGYDQDVIQKAVKYIERFGTLDGLNIINETDKNIFLVASGQSSKDTLSLESHLKMMAAIQPFISGAISKTVNLPEQTTVEEIKEVYYKSWQMGLKAIAVYRDGSKGDQPLSRVGLLQCPDCQCETELVSGCYRCPNCGTTVGCG